MAITKQKATAIYIGSFTISVMNFNIQNFRNKATNNVKCGFEGVFEEAIKMTYSLSVAKRSMMFGR